MVIIRPQAHGFGSKHALLGRGYCIGGGAGRRAALGLEPARSGRLLERRSRPADRGLHAHHRGQERERKRPLHLPLQPRQRLSRQARLGQSARRLQRGDPALSDFSEAIKLDPKHARALSNRCWTQAIIGAELKRALADCNESLRLNNKDDNTFDSRGFTYLKLGDWERAIADYDKALSFYRRRAWSLYGRGWAKLKKGDKSGEADIAAAKAITPDIAEQFAAYGVK